MGSEFEFFFFFSLVMRHIVLHVFFFFFWRIGCLGSRSCFLSDREGGSEDMVSVIDIMYGINTERHSKDEGFVVHFLTVETI